MEAVFKLFGPIVILAAGREITPPGRRVRALLAMLLTEPGGVISRAQLGRELWGENPPASGQANLRSYISALRGWLRGQCDGLMVAAQGSLLCLTGAASSFGCDVLAFERDLALARPGAGAAGDTGDIERHLANAVAARRGVPFEGIPLGPGLTATATVLEARWRTAVEDYAEVLLGRGGCRQARDLLLRFTAEHPTRERAWEQLMVAYYREGEIASSLATFQRARSLLRDLLGVDPGPSLTRCQLSILRREAPWYPVMPVAAQYSEACRNPLSRSALPVTPRPQPCLR